MKNINTAGEKILFSENIIMLERISTWKPTGNVIRNTWSMIHVPSKYGSKRRPKHLTSGYCYIYRFEKMKMLSHCNTSEMLLKCF